MHLPFIQLTLFIKKQYRTLVFIVAESSKLFGLFLEKLGA